MEFDTKQKRDQAKQELDKVSNVNTKVRSKKKPNIIIYDISSDVEPAELVSKYIIPDNENLKQMFPEISYEHMSVRFTQRPKAMRNARSSGRTNNTNELQNNAYNAILEVVPEVYRILMNTRHLYVGFKRCKVAPYLPFIQCFRCCGFGHTTKNCTKFNNEAHCSHCGESHIYRECTKKEDSAAAKCINCVKRNAKTVKKTDTKHGAISQSCPCLINARERLIDDIEW